MTCPYCGYTIDDRGYLGGEQNPEKCPRCGASLKENTPPPEKKNHPGRVFAILLTVILLIAAVFTPWKTLKANWEFFKEMHPAMTERIPTLTDNGVEIDMDETLQSLASIFDYTDNTLNKVPYAKSTDDRDALLINLSTLYLLTDIESYGKIYLAQNGESESVIQEFEDSYNAYIEKFFSLCKTPNDDDLIKECRKMNQDVAAMFDITFENF